MKTISFQLRILIFSTFCVFQSRAQSIIVSGLQNNPVSISNSYNNTGNGLKLIAYSDTLNITKNIKYKPVYMRYGLGINFSNLGKEQLNNIPLLAPQTGDASVTFTNKLANFNMYFRFSKQNLKGKFFEPYIEPFAGLARYSSHMLIKPNQLQQGYSPNDSTLSSYNALNMGIGVGCVFKISEMINIDIGLSKSFSMVNNDWTDISTVSAKNNMVAFCNSKVPDSIVQVSVGVNFVFDKWADTRTVYEGGDSEDSNDSNSYAYHSPTYNSQNNSNYYGSGYSGSSHSSYSGGGTSHVAVGGCHCGGHAK